MEFFDRVQNGLFDLLVGRDSNVERPTAPRPRDMYFDAVASTRPCDRHEAEKAIRAVYANLGEEPPEIVWVDSPLAGLKAAVILAWWLASDSSVDEPLLVRLKKSARMLDNTRRLSLSEQVHPGDFRPWQWRGFSGLSSPSEDLATEIMGEAYTVICKEISETFALDCWIDTWQSLASGPLPEKWLRELEAAGEILWARSNDEQEKIIYITSFALATTSVLDPYHPPPIHLNYGHFDTMSLLEAEAEPNKITHLQQKQLRLAADTVLKCGYWWPLKGVAIVCDRPVELHLDESNKLHATGGPAIRYRDGFGFYAIRGMRVTEKIAMKQFTARDIDQMENIEWRRAMVDVYGAGEYLRDSGAKLVHRDKFGVLYEKRVDDDESIMVVEVKNKTPERDGSFKKYFLRVPPNLRTARQAVAWSFGLQERDYAPDVET